MKNTNTIFEKAFIGFGIVTIISGIFLIIQQQYLIGISGSIVGIWLILLKMNKLKDSNKE